MRFEDLQVTGSYQVTGSLDLPHGPQAGRPTNVSGSLFYNTDRGLEVFDGEGWTTGSAGGSGGGGGGGAASSTVDYLVVAGGGAGGFRTTSKPFYMGGGGAGGFRSGSITASSGSSYTITVGAGGAAYAGSSTFGNGSNGGDSSLAGTDITTVTSTGGGYGSTADHPSAADAAVTNQNGADGGSGGGATGWNNNAGTGGSGTTGQGNNGGTGVAGADAAGAGGGGAGGAGTPNSGTAGRDAGNGGAGLQSDITGTNTYYAAGARGGRGYSGVNGAEGTDGTGYRGVANSGDGGLPQNTTAGESGVVIVSYDSGSIGGAGGIKGDAGGGKRYHQFNSSDTFLVGTTTNFNTVTSNLVAHYDAGDFASRGTSTFTDLQGSTNGTVNGATLGQNWYYDFDGSNDSITFGNVNWFNSDFTFEIWAKIDATHANDFALFALKRDGSDYTTPFNLTYDDRAANSRDSNILFNIGGGGSTLTIISTPDGDYTIGDWAHITCTVSGTAMVLYLNGVSSATGTIAGTRQTNSAPFRINGPYTNGGTNHYRQTEIGQVRVYSDALTAAEVLQNYNATKTNFI